MPLVRKTIVQPQRGQTVEALQRELQAVADDHGVVFTGNGFRVSVATAEKHYKTAGKKKTTRRRTRTVDEQGRSTETRTTGAAVEPSLPQPKPEADVTSSEEGGDSGG